MTSVRNTNFKELKEIAEIGKQRHVGGFLSNKSLETHKADFNTAAVTYLSIISSSGLLAGYIIVCKEKKSRRVRLKRILIDENHLGIGQEAIILLENYCIREFNSEFIWLDVYESNSKAVYVYEKLGYVKFKEKRQKAKSVLYYDKRLQT